MQIDAAAPAQARRRWLPRFGLRTLIVSVALFGALLGTGMAWYRSHVAEFERQAKIAALFNRHGGGVTWEPVLPKWLRWLPGQSSLRQIVHVRCGHIIPFDEPRTAPRGWLEIMEQLRSVSTLRSFESFECFLDEDMVRKLGELQQLESVTVRCIGKKKRPWDNSKKGFLRVPDDFDAEKSRNNPANYEALRPHNPEFAEALDALVADIQKRLPNATVTVEVLFGSDG